VPPPAVPLVCVVSSGGLKPRDRTIVEGAIDL
jgi:hypothetical protein